ncbi:MAG: hypothetical protein IJA87_02395 [Clostridia bacterium]|nr:hypothetical protein [Clostridia bacterium]
MSLLIEKYNEVIKTIGDINGQILNAKNEINALKKEQDNDIEIKISSLEDLSKKIDEYILKVQSFQLLAEKNLTSKNVLSIETPPEYRVNLNRLKNWSMLIDPNAKDDPYAQRVYVVAKCDEHFLKLKAKECEEKIDELKEIVTSTNYARIQQLENDIQELKTQLKKFVQSESIWTLCNKIVEDNYKYWFEVSPTTFNEDGNDGVCFAPGAYAAPLPVDEAQHEKLGRLYNVNLGEVLIPVEISLEKEFVLTISCAPSKDKQLDKGIQNLILNIVNNSPAGTQKVYVLDGLRFNTTSLGSLKKIENTFALEQVPRNQEQITATLESIVASFADIDDMLEDCESVKEYNGKVSKEKRIPLTTIVLYGWPKAYEGKNKELLTRIMTNYERYGVSIVTVTYKKAEPLNKEIEDNSLPEYATHNATHIRMFPNDTTIALPDEKPQKFTWYVFEDELSDEYAESLKSFTITKEVIGNEYIKRYSLTTRPQYVREYKKIELPFGIDGKDNAHSVSFENENFATYLVGASRSGKSTLLHTLIAGLIRNYHPDNVELWLADFKQLEFKRYIKHLPPHVKYVLLDESTELVFDLIDRLTNEMLERQKLFARLGRQRIDQVNPNELTKPLPVIFVILDEFSIMSQSIAESPIYKLRLQNILAKGAALGIKFLFSSQTFTTGVAGLTATARAQIQQRISMKGSKEEISETLELSSNLKTEQVKNWMDALPPHYALVKFRTGADTPPQVKRFLVMYFKDYEPRDVMIDEIASSMHSVEKFNPGDLSSYVDKKPVLVDGNTFEAFTEGAFLNDVATLKENNHSFDSNSELCVSFGTPRLMVNSKLSVLSAETRENILLIGRAAEQACSASILLSAMKSVKAQNGKVQVWAYGKNRLFSAYKDIFIENGFEIVEGIDNICEAISKTKQNIANKVQTNTLIVLIGMDRVCMDFDFVDDSAADTSSNTQTITNVRQKFVESNAVISSEDEEKRRQYAMKWLKYKKSFVKEAETNGKNKEEIIQMLSELELKFRKEQGYVALEETQPSKVNNNPEDKQLISTEKKQGAYNASKDFEYIVMQGSRLGYHFFMNLSSLADLKQTGLKQDYFRYKLSFQISVDDSRTLFGNKIASTLPEHICQYDDALERYSFRPYLHKNVGWEGWNVGEDGKVINPYEEIDN